MSYTEKNKLMSSEVLDLNSIEKNYMIEDHLDINKKYKDNNRQKGRVTIKTDSSEITIEGPYVGIITEAAISGKMLMDSIDTKRKTKIKKKAKKVGKKLIKKIENILN